MRKYTILILFILAVVLALIPTLSVNANAAEIAGGSCGKNVTWTLDDGGVLTISGNGAMSDYVFDVATQGTNAPWYSYNSTITSVVVGEGITYVGEFSFMNLHKITSVTLPSTLDKIGGHSFQHLYGLKSIALPKRLKTIGTYAFAGPVFEELHLPESLQSLEGLAISANKVYIDSLEHWLDLDFLPDPADVLSQGSCSPVMNELYIGGSLVTHITIPDGTTEILPYRFYKVASLQSVTIPNSVTSIGEGAFWGSGLREALVPDSVTTLGKYVFMECKELTKARLPEGLEEIPAHIFRSCGKLSDFVMPNSVNSIAENAFEGCVSLTHFNETNSLENIRFIGGYAFCGCKNLQFGDLKLSEELQWLGVGYAFGQCHGITSVTIPSNLHTIPWETFDNCINLSKVVIKDGVDVLGSDCFSECNLTSVVIPASVVEIQYRAFYGNNKLTAIYFMGDSCKISDPVFTNEYPVGTPGTTTIRGNKGSSAEAYALRYGYAFDKNPETCEFGYHSLTTTVIKEATCLVDGEQIATCSLCDYAKNEIIYYPGHMIVNGVCQSCNIRFDYHGEIQDGGFWALTNDGILHLYNDSDGMGAGSAPWEKYADKIQRIIIAERVYHRIVKQDGYGSVYYPNLTTIELWGNEMFMPSAYHAPKLTTFVIAQWVTAYHESNGILYHHDDRSNALPAVWAYPAGLKETVLNIEKDGGVGSDFLMKGNCLEKIYTQQNTVHPAMFNKNNTALTDIYFLNKDMEVYEDLDFVWVKGALGDRNKVTIHGYKGAAIEKMAKKLGYRFEALAECDKTGHKVKPVAQTAATCVAVGTASHYKCSACGALFADKKGTTPVTLESLTIAVDKTNHTGNQEVRNAVEASCTKTGYTGDIHCADCGDLLVNGSAVDVTTHTLVRKEPISAGCLTEGTVEYWQCSDCQAMFTDQNATAIVTDIFVPALGHDWADEKEQDGYLVQTCTDCGESKRTKLPPAGMDVEMPEVSEALQNGMLTEEEKKRVEQGEELEIYLEVSDISTNVPETEKQKVEELLGDSTVGIYLDINLFKKVGDDRASKVSEPGQKVSICITVPQELLNMDANVSREYRIIRVHNGIAEILEGIFDKAASTFIFETDGFSTYALTYQDSQVEVLPVGMDPMLLIGVAAVVVVAVAAVTLILILRKKRT